MLRVGASRKAVVTLAPPRPVFVAAGVVAIGVFGFIAAVVPLSAPPQSGYGPFIRFGLLLAAVALVITSLMSSRVGGTEGDIRIFGALTETRIPIDLVTSVEVSNGLLVVAGGKTYGCIGYGASFGQQIKPSKRFARAGMSVTQWVAARRGGATAAHQTASYVLLRRWLIVGPPACIAVALAYSTILWGVATPIRSLLWPAP